MDLETIETYFPSLLSEENITENLLQRIKNAPSNARRVELCLPLFEKYSHVFEKQSKTEKKTLRNCNKGMLARAKHLQEVGNYVAALELYNQCLCSCAKEDDADEEVLAEIYLGRAWIYSEIKLESECWSNLRKLQATKSVGSRREEELNYLMKKVAGVEVVRMNRKGMKKKISEPNLRYKCYENIPFMVEDIRLEYTDEFGYYLVTQRNLRPGDIIMKEKPYSAVLMPEEKYKKCATCLSDNYLNLMPCTGCNHAMFCSAECLAEGQRLFHCYECPIMDDIEKLLTPELMLALRNTIRGFSVYCNLDELVQVVSLAKTATVKRERDFMLDFRTNNEKDTFRVVCNQATNEKLRSADELLQLSLASTVMYMLLLMKTDLIERITTKEHHNLLMELLLRFTQIATVNSFAIAGLPCIAPHPGHEIEHQFAIATYPLSSYLNHSCVPNITKTNVGNNHETLLVLATRPIKAGEQIFDCYFSDVHHYNTRRVQRQAILQEQYKFTCFCTACTHDYTIHRDLHIKVPHINLIHVINENAGLCNFVSKDVIWQKFQRYCHALRNLNHLYPCKEIYVFYKCLLHCVWLLYKKPQILYTLPPPSARTRPYAKPS